MTDDRMDDLRRIMGPDVDYRIAAIEAAATAAAGRRLRFAPDSVPDCEACNDDYWIPDAQGKVAACTECLKRHEDRRLAESQTVAGISELHRACSLANYQPTTRHAEEALRVASQYIDMWAEVTRRGQGLYLWGPPGVGKTHLAYAVVNALLEVGQQALVIREVDLFAELGARYGPDPGRAVEGERLLQAARTADLLLLDDLGAAKSTESRQEARYMILDHRISAARPTIITSNHYPDHLIDLIGDRTVSRLHGSSFVLPVTGPDHRRPADQKSRR